LEVPNNLAISGTEVKLGSISSVFLIGVSKINLCTCGIEMQKNAFQSKISAETLILVFADKSFRSTESYYTIVSIFDLFDGLHNFWLTLTFQTSSK
jgi:hypothetical protein